MRIQRPYEKIIAWQVAYALCVYTYRVTATFPSHEKFGLTSQMRRAASSVPLNIAEGNAKRSKPDRARFIEIALGSLEELHCASRLSFDLSYMNEEKFMKIDQEVHRVSYLLTRLRSVLV